jgi:hypothetical protein
MIYREPGFLTVVWFGPPPLPLASCLSFSLFQSIAGRACWRERGGGGGAKSYDGEKAWSSINHSILSGHTWAHWWDLEATRPELAGAATPGSSSRRSYQTQYFACQRPSVLLNGLSVMRNGIYYYGSRSGSDFDNFRFRLLSSYGSGSGSVSRS